VGGRAADAVGWFDADSLRQRVADGVVALSVAHAGGDWLPRVAELRAKLPPAQACMATAKKTSPS